MTHAQIQSAIDATIKGQGNQVDAGGKLAEILSSLLGNSAETAEVDDFEEFDSATAYSANDIVRKDGKLYKFNAAHQGAWTGTDVTATSVFAYLYDKFKPLAITEADIAASGRAALSNARMAAIEAAPELEYQGYNYSKCVMSSEVYAQVKSLFSALGVGTFAHTGNLYLHFITCSDTANVMSISSVSALALVQDTASKWWLVEVEV